MTIKERNSKDLQKAWKKFLREQNEKEKTKKENQKAEEKGWLVSPQDDWWNPVNQYGGDDKKQMKTFIVTVEMKMVDNKVYCTKHFKIMAHTPDEAFAIVHNSMELHFEPNFEITKVEEWTK